MSRIGKKPVKIPTSVKVEVRDGVVTIAGASARLERKIPADVTVEYDGPASEIRVSRVNNERQSRALHGTIRALLANMVEGVTKGFSKKMALYGAGYNVKLEGQKLFLQVGYARPASLAVPAGVSIDIQAPAARGNDTPALFTIVGADKHAVGQFAADVRRTRPPEPYKGKGVRYADEQITRKVGKAFASGGA